MQLPSGFCTCNTMRFFALVAVALPGSCLALRLATSAPRHARAVSPTMAASAPLEAILFDCDGVLADTERDGHRVSFNKVFRERNLGFEWGVDEYGRLCEVGGGKERMVSSCATPDYRARAPVAHQRIAANSHLQPDPSRARRPRT